MISTKRGRAFHFFLTLDNWEVCINVVAAPDSTYWFASNSIKDGLRLKIWPSNISFDPVYEDIISFDLNDDVDTDNWGRLINSDDAINILTSRGSKTHKLLGKWLQQLVNDQP